MNRLGPGPVDNPPPSLLSPGNTRTVLYDCGCGLPHPTEVPAIWDGVKTMWLMCPIVGQSVRVTVDCSPLV